MHFQFNIVGMFSILCIISYIVIFHQHDKRHISSQCFKYENRDIFYLSSIIILPLLIIRNHLVCTKIWLTTQAASETNSYCSSLSKAFDTIDHDLLDTILKDTDKFCRCHEIYYSLFLEKMVVVDHELSN